MPEIEQSNNIPRYLQNTKQVLEPEESTFTGIYLFTNKKSLKA
jgi:hypothetical protein